MKVLPAEPLVRIVRRDWRRACIALVHAGLASDVRSAAQRLQALEGVSLDYWEADRLAIALGYLPFEIWDVEDWVAAAVESERGDDVATQGSVVVRGQIIECEIIRGTP